MQQLVDHSGAVAFGLFDEPVEEVNYLDHRLETPMGLPVPRKMRAALANQFHFIGIMGPELIIGVAVVDLKYLSNGFAYVYDRKTREMSETKKLLPGSKHASIDPRPDDGRSHFSSPELTIDLEGGRLLAAGRDFEIRATLAMEQASPLRLCTKAGYRGWVYTQKTAPIGVNGTVKIGSRTIDLSSPSYSALTDWTCGYMRRETYWNWAATAWTLPDGRALGMNLSCGVNETSFTENALWLGSSMTKVDTVSFGFDPKDLKRPWRIASFDDKVELRFHPEGERGEKIAAGLISSRFSQLMGVFEGKLRLDDGEEILIEDCPGFVEDHYAKW